MKTLLLSLALVLAPPHAHAQDGRPPAPAPERAWQQDAPYRAPDFEGYFPDDAEGGLRLDELFRTSGMRAMSDAEYLTVVREGLRRTTQHRTLILSELGNRLIWGQAEQHPDAIELCYHAADFSPAAEVYGTRHYAVYFGLSVVTDKTPAILRTLADLCVEIDDPNDIGRVAWGAAGQLEELLTYLAPHLASEDRWVREKAEAVERIFKGELGAFDWAAERAKQPARPKPWKELPEVRRVLSGGDSTERLLMLRRIANEGLTRDMNDSYLADFAACARDVDPEVREQVAILVGGAWIWRAGLHRISDPAVDLLLELSADPVNEVRAAAVYYGLSTYHGEREDVLRRLVAMATDTAELPSHGRLEWALERHGERLRALLEGDLAGDDPARARDAYALYQRVFETRPEVTPEGIAGPRDLVGTWVVTLVAGGREGLSLPPLEVQADEAGVLRIVDEAAEGLADDLLGDLAWAEVGEVLHFNFVSTVETAVLRSSARLLGDRIEGTSRLDGGDSLIVWTATRP
jgi:hypothetical protein